LRIHRRHSSGEFPATRKPRHSTHEIARKGGGNYETRPDRLRQIKMIYTTNAIESLHMQLDKVLKTMGHFPSDEQPPS
jgi:transposase-like protein